MVIHKPRIPGVPKSNKIPKHIRDVHILHPYFTHVNREKHGKAVLNHHFPRCFLPPDRVQQQWLEPTAAWQHFWIMTDANGGFFELYLTIVYMLL